MESWFCKYTFCFLLYWLIVCPLFSQTESDIPLQLTREEAGNGSDSNESTELQPPFDPRYDSPLLYIPDLGVIITQDSDELDILTPEQAPALELRDTPAIDREMYLLPSLGYSKGESLHLTLDGILNVLDTCITVKSFCSIHDPFQEPFLIDNREKLFRYYLKGTGSGELQLSVWDWQLFTGCTVLPSDRNILLLTVNGNYATFPGNLTGNCNWESGTRLWFLLNKNNEVVYKPFFLKETMTMEPFADTDLPVLSCDLLLAYEPIANILEWSGRIALKKSISAAEPAVQVTAGAALSAGNAFLMLLPEIKIRYWAAESFSLVFNLYSYLEGDGALEADQMQDKLLTQPLAADHLHIDQGLLNSLSLHYSFLNFFTLNTMLVFYTGTWNISRENFITHELITDLDLAIDFMFYYSPAPFDVDVRLTLLQGLLFNLDRHSISCETIFKFHSLPLELSANLDWLTAPSVILPQLRYSESGGNAGIKGRYTVKELITIEAGCKIIYDNHINFLDYNIAFSISYHIK